MTDAPENETFALLTRLFGAEDHLWSIGTLAGFMGFERPDTPQISVPADEAGALVLEAPGARARLRPGARLLAFETLSSDPRGWNHGIALCLPTLASSPTPDKTDFLGLTDAAGPVQSPDTNAVLTSGSAANPTRGSATVAPSPASARRPGRIGATRPAPQDRRLSYLPFDDGAVRHADRARPILDLGLGHAGMTCAFRPAPEAVGQALLLAGLHWSDCRDALTALAGDWITETLILRAERQNDGNCPIHAIPAAGLRGLTHAVTTPVPPGLLPLAHLFPPHPLRVKPGLRRPFDPDIHDSFQAILARHGRPDLRRIKAEILARLTEGAPPPDPAPSDRHALAVIRVTLRQWTARFDTPPPAPWLRRFDRPLLTAVGGAK